jgi:hypothetical protein
MQDGRDALELAKNDATRAALRGAPPLISDMPARLSLATATAPPAARDTSATAALTVPAAPPQLPAMSAVVVPVAIAAWLTDLDLAPHGARLVADHRLRDVSECAMLDDDDLARSGLTRPERVRFKRAASRLAAAASSSPRFAPAAPGAASLVTPLAPACQLPPLLQQAASSAATSAMAGAFSVSPDSAFDVMISYRITDSGAEGDRSVFALKSALEARGVSVFVGESNITAASNWISRIQRGIANCKAFVIMCSPTYGHETLSPWTKREFELAVLLKKPLVPVWHSGPYPPPEVALVLGATQRIPAAKSVGFAEGSATLEVVVEELLPVLLSLGITPVVAAHGGAAGGGVSPGGASKLS